MGAKIDQNSIIICSPRWGASWNRFLMDFGGFREPSWGVKSSQDRSKIDHKNHEKNDDKSVRLGAPRGGELEACHGRAGPDPPPLSRQIEHRAQNRAQCTVHTAQQIEKCTPSRRSAVADFHSRQQVFISAIELRFQR